MKIKVQITSDWIGLDWGQRSDVYDILLELALKIVDGEDKPDSAIIRHGKRNYVYKRETK